MRERSGFGRVLTYLQFAIGGAIGGIAVVNTFGISMPTPNGEHLAMVIGAVALAGLAAIFHAA
jgi:hypothetical protein